MLHPILVEYINLISSFLSGNTSAESFKHAYLEVHSRDNIPATDETIELGLVLNTFFNEVDSFVDSLELRDEKDIDEVQLRKEAEWALGRLRELAALG